VGVVLFAYAGAEPGTVVVVPGYAAAAGSAVLGSETLLEVAQRTIA